MKLVLIISGVLGVALSSPSFASECDEVSIITFDAELYAPENESTIEARAFEKKFIGSGFVEELVSAPLGEKDLNYRPADTRVAINHFGRKIFIDRYGVVRDGEHFFKIDPRPFERSLMAQCMNK